MPRNGIHNNSVKLLLVLSIFVSFGLMYLINIMTQLWLVHFSNNILFQIFANLNALGSKIDLDVR